MYSNLYIPSHPYTFVLKWPFDWVGGVSSFQKFLWIYSEMIHGGFIGILRTTFSVRQIYRPSSNSEAATMYKLKGQSLNRRTGQGFKQKELVRPAGLSSKVHVLQSAKNKVSNDGNYILHFEFYPLHLTHCIWKIA